MGSLEGLPEAHPSCPSLLFPPLASDMMLRDLVLKDVHVAARSVLDHSGRRQNPVSYVLFLLFAVYQATGRSPPYCTAECLQKGHVWCTTRSLPHALSTAERSQEAKTPHTEIEFGNLEVLEQRRHNEVASPSNCGPLLHSSHISCPRMCCQ